MSKNYTADSFKKLEINIRIPGVKSDGLGDVETVVAAIHWNGMAVGDDGLKIPLKEDNIYVGATQTDPMTPQEVYTKMIASTTFNELLASQYKNLCIKYLGIDPSE